MSKKYLSLAAFVLAVIAAAYFWTHRNPLSRLDAPTGYIFSGLEIIDSETGKEAVIEEYAFFADMFLAMADQLAAAAEQGYLMVDPRAETATLLVEGTTAVAPLPEPGKEVPFDVGTSGSAPIFLSYSAGDDRFTLRAPESALEIALDFNVSFVRAQGDIQDLIAAQNDMQAQRIAALAEWNSDIDRLQAELTARPEATARTYRLNLPGDFTTIAIPLSATYDDSDDAGQSGVVDRVTGETLFNLRLDTAEALKRIFAAERESYLGPDDDIRILHEDDHTIIVARRDRPFFFLSTVITGSVGYAVHADAEDLAQLRTAWQAAESLSGERPDPGVVTSADFDAMTWFRDQGAALAARTKNNAGFAESFHEQVTTELVADKLLSGQSGIRGSLMLRESSKIDDPFATLFEVNYACLPRLRTDESPVTLHERLSTNPFSNGLAYRDLALDAIAASISHNAFGVASDHVFNPLTDQAIRQPAVWAWQSPVGAFGADNLSYFGYRVRDLGGQFQLVCATSSENPYAALAGLQILDDQPLPGLSGLPPMISARFERYPAAHAIGDGLYEVRESPEGGYLLIDTDGTRLSDIPFERSWSYDEIQAFKTTDAKGRSALWSFSGEQLLPYEYDDIDDAPNGIIEARKGDQTLFYSLAERRFVPQP
ncbi:hypothetical protein [Paracoccus lutimaris]|uniref:WG repeat protein n=1 Tax=Paracoccus lutimaris TaxID=1490030 RepID=A0A368YP65_9RHOB|nr:hypothetical protein [Paracoccus lutimaris]RCW81399.1 hypothetical protein DFP89_11575 [Paracoccus lutimaris]